MVAASAPYLPTHWRPVEPGPGSIERVLFQDALVTVTTARVQVQQTTYPTLNITSVRELVEPRPVSVLALGGCLLIMGLLCASFETVLLGMSGLGLVIIVAYFAIPPKYWVRIGTAGAETNAVFSKDPAWTRAVVAAINEAIVVRG